MMQEVFLRFLERPDAFKGRSRVSTYLFSIATHLCLNRLRNRGARNETWQTRVAHHIEQVNQQSALDELTHARRLARAILGEADETTAMIAFYHFVDGLPQGEVGKLVGLSRVRVNQRLQQFRSESLQLAGEEAV